MNNKIIILLLSTIFLSGCNNSMYISYSSSLSRATAACAIAGAKISSKDSMDKKYKRSQCPVCKGKGWYISGDGIAKVECGYCEPDSKAGKHDRLKVFKK